jgi:hypothetical protein
VHIGWVVDHPKPDLAGSVLAAYQLASRGASAAIISMYEQGVVGRSTIIAVEDRIDIGAMRAQCVKTRVPLAGILVEPRPARA